MFFSREKRKLNSDFFRQSAFTVLGLIVVAAIAWPLFKNISKQYRVNSEIEELKKEIAAFESKNSDLKKTLSYLESDQFSQEQARISLNYKKPGEEVVIVKNLEDQNSANNDLSAASNFNAFAVEPISNPTRWWRYFFLK